MYLRNRINIRKHGKQLFQTFGLCLHNFFCLHSSLMPNSKQLIKKNPLGVDKAFHDS